MAELLSNITDIHFIRPWAWLLLIPAFLIFIWQTKSNNYQSNWANLIDQHLLQWILPNSENSLRRTLGNNILFLFWILIVAAISGPSWQRLPQPIYSTTDSNIIVLDLSSSMDANDVTPSRLTRAKYKLYDLLEKQSEGNTALIVYAGDAFILSPLTSDQRTIENLIRPLETNLMPILGSQPQLGVKKAIELLRNANQNTGNIIWVTDGAEPDQLDSIAVAIDGSQFALKILAVGTEQGAPIKKASGNFLKDSQGNIVIPKLNYAQLAQFADNNNATLTPTTPDNKDIELIIQSRSNPLNSEYQKEDIFADSWHDSGYWLILLLIPLMLYAFKHKNIVALFIVSFVSLTSPFSTLEASVTDKLFLNKNQQGQKHYNQGNLEQAENTFKNNHWKAIAAYKNGNYSAASGYLSNAQTDQELYNLANSLALAGEYQAAIESYEKAIELNPQHEDAIYNKNIIEDLLDQQQEDQNESDQEEQNKEQQESQEQQEQQESAQEQEESDQSPSDKEQQEQKSQEQQLKELSEQEKQQELEQWLKKISDDPGRLLRNKMKLEYNRRGYRSQPSKTW